ncbi:predicted protein [Enterococcus faecalis ATCC 4200]|nr:predicted protein [Enterococcus faecalis ATCC 4200]DAW96367.1 MAG TPA: hypothetical protein [Bacteriophage sp.]
MLLGLFTRIREWEAFLFCLFLPWGVQPIFRGCEGCVGGVMVAKVLGSHS